MSDEAPSDDAQHHTRTFPVVAALARESAEVYLPPEVPSPRRNTGFSFNRVVIAGLASIDAPERVSSVQLCEPLVPTLQRLTLGTDVLEALTGITARRFWPRGTTMTEVAAQAGERALAAAGVDRSHIGALLSTSVCKDFIEPSLASSVHGKLGLASDCVSFDVGNACLAFLDAIAIAGNMLEREQIDYALLVDAEGSRQITEATVRRLAQPGCDLRLFRDHFAALTLGSGAVAMVLTRSDLAPEGHRVVGSVSLAATEHNSLCRGQPEEMITDAGGLLTAGLTVASKTFARAREVLGWSPERLDECVLHQVSTVHTGRLVERLALDAKKVFGIVVEYGNIGPASLPITLEKSASAGRLRRGDRVGLMGIGSGLNCAMMELVW